MKRFIAAILVVLLMVPLFTAVSFADNKNLIIVHYHRDDADYTGWNLWLWNDGASGKQISFSDDDDFGKVAVYTCDTSVSKVGVIVRLNDWEKKDVEQDRFISLTSERTEIWIYSGVTEFAYTTPEGCTPYDYEAVQQENMESANIEGAFKVNVHYRRYDGNYDGWNLWLWKEGQDGAAYGISSYDDFGAVISLGIEDMTGVESLGFIVRLNEWEQKDVADDRFMSVEYAVDDTLNIWLVTGDSNVYYALEDVDLTPKFLSAKFVDLNTVSFVLTVAPDDVKADEFLLSADNGSVTEFKTIKQAADNSAAITATLENGIDMGKGYTLQNAVYGEISVSMSELFDTDEFEAAYSYLGNDLGAVILKDNTCFRVWAPTATTVNVALYENGDGDNLIETIPMEKSDNGTWALIYDGNLGGTYYTYLVTLNGKTNETVDVYAKAVGINGDRGMVIDLNSTDPDGWDKDKKPTFVNSTDAEIYELHVRDFSIDPAGNMTYKGKYLAFTESGTTTSGGTATGVDHLKELGITHVHLLPVFDFATIDETKLDEEQFNWGYDPKNYNVPEGSYSTNPYAGEVRIYEFKRMVQALHENGIRVVMDVVYNHTSATEDSWFSLTVPEYYYRMEDGAYSNASGCGNETASERAMVRKYIVDSVVYWATEYHIDGFRFDLMGIHDIETMNAVREALDVIDPTILVYGEGWTSSSSPLDESERALKANTMALNRIAAFSDDIRDGIKGSVFNSTEKGFVTGAAGLEETIKFGVVAATLHSQVDYSKVNYSSIYWAGSPLQCISYCSAHDNLSLWDKIASSNTDDDEATRIRMNKLAAAIIQTCQGIPFMQAGEEILRSKPALNGGFDSNSYKSSDYTNALRWNRLDQYSDVYEYYKGLIAFRKEHSALRLTTTKEISDNLSFVSDLPANVVAYTIENSPNGEMAEALFVVYNANREAIEIALPEGEWDVYVNDVQAGTKPIESVSGSVSVSAISAMVLVKGAYHELRVDTTAASETAEDSGTVLSPWIIIIMAIAAAIVVAAVIVVIMRKKRQNV